MPIGKNSKPQSNEDVNAALELFDTKGEEFQRVLDGLRAIAFRRKNLPKLRRERAQKVEERDRNNDEIAKQEDIVRAALASKGQLVPNALSAENGLENLTFASPNYKTVTVGASQLAQKQTPSNSSITSILGLVTGISVSSPLRSLIPLQVGDGSNGGLRLVGTATQQDNPILNLVIGLIVAGIAIAMLAHLFYAESGWLLPGLRLRLYNWRTERAQKKAIVGNSRAKTVVPATATNKKPAAVLTPAKNPNPTSTGGKPSATPTTANPLPMAKAATQQSQPKLPLKSNAMPPTAINNSALPQSKLSLPLVPPSNSQPPIKNQAIDLSAQQQTPVVVAQEIYAPKPENKSELANTSQIEPVEVEEESSDDGTNQMLAELDQLFEEEPNSD